MGAPVIVDAGPLVAFLDRNDPLHAWACARVGDFNEPMVTCEAVLSECLHLTAACDPGASRLFALFESGGLRIGFDLDDHLGAVAQLVARYRNVPMSLADACLVRMSELHDRSSVFTADSDFKVYRRNGRQTIPLLFPR